MVEGVVEEKLVVKAFALGTIVTGGLVPSEVLLVVCEPPKAPVMWTGKPHLDDQ